MEENNELLETPQNPDEETETPQTEDADDTPTLEDYQRLAETKKQLSARLAKAEADLKKFKSQPNKPNEIQSGLTREEAILIAKGYTDDEVALAIKLSKVNEVPILEAVKDEFFTTKVEERKAKERSEKASLPSSSGSMYKSQKPTGEMTREEHEAYYKKVMGL
jgi:hypothetical protein